MSNFTGSHLYKWPWNRILNSLSFTERSHGLYFIYVSICTYQTVFMLNGLCNTKLPNVVLHIRTPLVFHIRLFLAVCVPNCEVRKF